MKLHSLLSHRSGSAKRLHAKLAAEKHDLVLVARSEKRLMTVCELILQHKSRAYVA